MRGDSHPNILSVEDDPLVARLLTVLLGREGFGVTHVADGKATLHALEENPPDLVLLDVMLPDTTGFEILEWIRKHPGLSGLPAIMLTAQVGEEDVQRGLRAGADGYIFKPFKPEPLLECIRRVLKI
jgi:DNA-binding response OmpR family regulator